MLLKIIENYNDEKVIPSVICNNYKHILEKEMATHCSFLAWRIPCTEVPGGLQFRVRHDLVTKK